MSRTGSWVPQKFRSVVDVICARKLQSTYANLPRGTPIMSASKPGMHSGLHSFSTNSNNTSTVANGVKNVKFQPQAPASPSFNFPYWLRWVLGTLLSILLPFWKHEWENLRRIEGEAELVVEGVEKVANVVEKVATEAEKVSQEVAQKLPENSKLMKAALVVETVSKNVAHDAQVTQEIIHKVEELKNGLDDLESFVEPIIDKLVKKEFERK